MAGKTEDPPHRQRAGSDPIEGSLMRRYIKITAVVAAYWVVSITLVFVNKHLLSGSSVKLEAPLFITFFQCIVTASLIITIGYLSYVIPNLRDFPKPSLNVDILKSILPLSTVFVGMISFNNLCLKYTGVAFYYVGRSLTTVFNVLLTYIILREKTSVQAVLCCVVVVIGFVLGVDQEGVSGSLSVIGVVFGILASLCVSLNSILTKMMLPKVDNSIWKLMFYNNINAILLLFMLMVFYGEIPIVWGYELLGDTTFWFMMTLGGVFGFAIAFITGLQIQVTSPLTHNISGTAKACAQTVIAVAWFQEIKTPLWWISNGLVLMGSAAYTRVRQLEMLKIFQEKNEDKQVLLKA